MGNRFHLAQSERRKSRRQFLKRAVVAGAAASAGTLIKASRSLGQTTPRVSGFDHVAVPMQNARAMVSFYRGLGMEVNEGTRICSVHFGEHKINLHRPEMWRNPEFTLRAQAARPPCGDFCFVWVGTAELLVAALDRVGAEVIEGPVTRLGGRGGGTVEGTSRYVRDPDGNLLEFILYP